MRRNYAFVSLAIAVGMALWAIPPPVHSLRATGNLFVTEPIFTSPGERFAGAFNITIDVAQAPTVLASLREVGTLPSLSAATRTTFASEGWGGLSSIGGGSANVGPERDDGAAPDRPPPIRHLLC